MRVEASATGMNCPVPPSVAGAVPPHECLETGHLAGLSFDDRLVVHFELAVRQTALDGGREFGAGQ